jgi:hypothetical protein
MAASSTWLGIVGGAQCARSRRQIHCSRAFIVALLSRTSRGDIEPTDRLRCTFPRLLATLSASSSQGMRNSSANTKFSFLVLGVFSKVDWSGEEGYDRLWPKRTEPRHRQHHFHSAGQCLEGIPRTEWSQGRQQTHEGNLSPKIRCDD